jgi:tetratricopeptide (TPR) repeat protein
VPIIQYCDENRLDVRERLELFTEVCSAIQHAHHKGVIHRDIKPSNVLVGRQEDKTILKVIDFGIAKATQEPLTTHTLVTGRYQFIGTPAYMSPEQAGLGDLDIDTRSDVYSLGVLLYELLTGTRPFEPRATATGGLEEFQRVIREQEPPRPSTRVRSLAGPELAAFLECRRLDPRQLPRAIASDLDWIVSKALEKDRARRYETANAIAQDVKRFLRHEPVTAIAPNTRYRVRKFVRRNRTAVAVAAIIVGLLAVGISATTWLAVEATRARYSATREAANRSQVARFLQEMLDAVRPARARGRDTAMLKEILDATAARLAGELRDQPDVGYELRRTIGRTYEAIGAMTNAIATQEEALALARKLFGSSHTNTASVLLELGRSHQVNSQYRAATEAYSEALAIARRAVGENHPLYAMGELRLGSVHSTLGNYSEAERLLVDSRRRLRTSLGDDHAETLTSGSQLATLFFRQGRLAEMDSIIVDNLERRRRIQGAEHPATLEDLAVLALLRQFQGRFAEAEDGHREVVDIKRKILGPTHMFTLTSVDNLAVVCGFQGRYAEAEKLCREALSVHEERLGRGNRNTLAMRSNLAEYLRNQGRFDESEALFREIGDVQATFMAESDPFRLETRNGLALQYFMQGRLPEAETLAGNILEIRRKSLPADDPSVGDAMAQLTLVLLAQRRFADAEPLARECVAVREKGPADDWRRFAALSQLGACYLGLNRIGEAAPLLRQGYEGLKAQETRMPAIERPRLREAIERLRALAEATGDTTGVSRWQEEIARCGITSSGMKPAAN